MFSKFKKFALMFTLCMSIFGVTAFAYTSIEGTEYPYMATYTTMNGYKVNCYSNGEFYVYGGVLYSSEDIYFEQLFSDGRLFTSSTVSGDYGLTSKDGNFTIYDKESNIIPPVIAPTVREAITKIVPDLSNQLKILLPVGVILLSVTLGVSLVPRLTRSFL